MDNQPSNDPRQEMRRQSDKDLHDIRDALPSIALQLKESNERKGWRLALVFILIAMAGITQWQFYQLLHEVRSCTQPYGECAQRYQAIDVVSREADGERFEIRRLENEIQLARARGDQLAVAERDRLRLERVARLDQLERELAELRKTHIETQPSREK